MKKLIPLILVIALISSSCEWSKYQLPVDININKTFTVDQTGAYSQSLEVTYYEIMNSLDIPAGATIDEVNIESISAKVVVLSDNKALAVNISGKVQLGSTSPEVFNNYYAPLVAVDNEYIGINTLIDQGVQGLKSKLEGYLKSKDFSSFNINISGNSAPTTGQRVHIQILIKISGTAKYTICANMPFFVGGDKCDPGI
jgi:hypothetical protein